MTLPPLWKFSENSSKFENGGVPERGGDIFYLLALPQENDSVIVVLQTFLTFKILNLSPNCDVALLTKLIFRRSAV